jgi:hypothetical protein
MCYDILIFNNTKPHVSSPHRLAAHDRAMRRDRIFARLLDGQSAVIVAAEEGVTPRRVRQMDLPRHCERSEAIQGQTLRRLLLDCFVAAAPRNDGSSDSTYRHHALAG